MNGGLTTRQAYRRGTLAGLSARAVETAALFVQLWLLTGVLPKASFGRLALALAVVQLAALLAGSGLQRLLIYRLSREPVPAGTMCGGPLAGAALGWSVLAGVALAALTALAAPVLAAANGDPELAPWLRSVAPLIPVTATLLVYGGWYQSRQRMVSAILVGQTLPVVLTVVGLAVVWRLGIDTRVVPVVLCVAPLLVLVGWWATKPVNPLRIASLDVHDAGFAIKATGNGLVHNLLRHADVLMLGLLGGPLLVAEYVVVLRLARVLRTAHDLLGPVFRPRIGFLLRNAQRRQLLDEYERIRLAAVVVALVPAVVLVAAGPAILGWFGAYAQAYPVLLLLVGATSTSVVFGKSGLLLLMAGRPGWSLATGGVVLGLNVALNLLLIPAWGAVGAAAATLASLLATQTLIAILLWRLDRLPTMTTEWAALLLVLVAATATTAAGLTEPWLAVAAYAATLGGVLVQHRATLLALVPRMAGPPTPVGDRARA